MAVPNIKKMDKRKRALYLATIGTIFGTLLLLVSICTTYWVKLEIPSGRWRNSSQAFVIKHHSGLWKICRHEVHNVSQTTKYSEHCSSTKLFPSEEEISKDPELDRIILDYTRTETAFAVIALVLAAMGHVFVFYSFREPRYMFKRLAAVLHSMTAASTFVSVEVLRNSVNYEKKNLPERHPTGSGIYFGYSYALAWMAFVCFLLAAITFMFCSRKRKRDKAADEIEAMENEPVHLGR